MMIKFLRVHRNQNQEKIKNDSHRDHRDHRDHRGKITRCSRCTLCCGIKIIPQIKKYTIKNHYITLL